jgi:hypothetical protein
LVIGQVYPFHARIHARRYFFRPWLDELSGSLQDARTEMNPPMMVYVEVAFAPGLLRIRWSTNSLPTFSNPISFPCNPDTPNRGPFPSGPVHPETGGINREK